MKRTNIYLDDFQLGLLKEVSERRGEPVAVLVREAVDAWLKEQGVRRIEPDEWTRRFDALLARRDEIAKRRRFDPDEVEADVAAAIREVRKARPARGR